MADGIPDKIKAVFSDMDRLCERMSLESEELRLALIAIAGGECGDPQAFALATLDRMFPRG